MKYLGLFVILSIPSLHAETFSVAQPKTLWRDGRGKVNITDDGISYEGVKKKENRTWKYLDIQYFDRISRKEFVILTYEDRKRYLGRDREYRFVITNGELTDDLFQTISKRIGRPVTNRVLPEVTQADYVVPVKHLHGLGGCEGELKFTKDKVYYVTGNKEDAREWLIARDVQSVWSVNPYALEIHVYDNNRHEFSRTRVYKFDLKASLDAEFYRALKLKLYGLETAPLLTR